MTKFIIFYKGPATPMEHMTPDQGQEIIRKWKDWMEKAGIGLVEAGAPMANGVTVVDNGTEVVATQLTGYSIIQAENVDMAKSLVVDHPFLSDKTGEFSIEIHELMPVPM